MTPPLDFPNRTDWPQPSSDCCGQPSGRLSNVPEATVLYPHQATDLEEMVRYVCQGAPLSAILYCTGAGKTVMALALVARLKAIGAITHALIVAPTDVIIDSFSLPEGSKLSDSTSTYPCPSLEPRGKDLESYLTLSGEPFSVFRATHILLVLFRERLRGLIESGSLSVKGKLLIIDEAHKSAEGRKLHDVRQLWLAHGGQVVMLTATPDRDDENLALPEGTPRVCRSLTSMMVGGEYAPEFLQSELLQVDCASANDSEGTAACFGRPIEPQKAGEQIAAHLEMEGWPKAIVRVRSAAATKDNDGNPIGQQVNYEVLRAVAKAVRDRGQRVFIATDVHISDKLDTDGYLRSLNREVIDRIRARTGVTAQDEGSLSEVRAYERSINSFEDSCVDVIVGLNTLVEGFDWRQCSHFYFLGIPYHVAPPLVQGIGRIMRRRKDIRGYPSEWVNQSKVVFVVGRATEELKDDWRKRMISVCAYLGTFQQWTPFGALSGVINELGFVLPEQQAAAREIIQRYSLDGIEDPYEQERERKRILEIMLPAVQLAESLIERPWGEFSVKARTDITLAAMQWDPKQAHRLDTPEKESRERRLIRAIAFQLDRSKRDRFIAAVMEENPEGDLERLKQAIPKALEKLAEYENEPQQDSPAEGLSERMLMTLDAQSIEHIAGILGNRSNPLTERADLVPNG